MVHPSWLRPGQRPDQPNAARVYDYLLGGTHHFEADRRFADQWLEMYPQGIALARANRAFLGRAVRWLAQQGVDQFLDIGSGLPTLGNVHEIAQAINPAAKIVYGDIDPLTVVHCHDIFMIDDVRNATAIECDINQPEAILSHPDVQRMLDFRRPIALLLVAVLHYVPNDTHVIEVVETLAQALPAGSYVVISHITPFDLRAEEYEEWTRLGAQLTTPANARTRDQVMALFNFAHTTLVEPGLVYAPRWRPDGPDDPLYDAPERSALLVGVGRKDAEG